MQQEVCTIESLQRNTPSANIILPWIMVACSMTVVLIWPLVHTMALRNILLLTGGIIGAWYLIRERVNLYQKPALPLFFIFLLFAWIGIHYLLFAHNPELELEQIKGIWLRALLACLLGISTGLFARNNRRAQLLLWVGFSSFLIIYFFNYAWVSFTRNDWAIPYPVLEGLYQNKISVAFYGILLLSLSCGVISYASLQTSKSNGRNFLVSLFLIGLVFLAFVFVGTKTGITTGLILFTLLILIYFTNANKSFTTWLITSIFIILIGGMTYLHLKLNPEWHNFFSAVAVGIQIDQYPNWQDIRAYDNPMLADGTRAPESAYTRVAYATKGLRILLENPFGYGLVHESFRHFLSEDLTSKVNFSTFSFTHSGWLDFSLCLGIPGILLIWSSMGSAIYYSYKKNAQWAYCSRWMLAGTFIVLLCDNVGHDHFLETLFYLVVLISAGNLPLIRQNLGSAPNHIETPLV